MGTRGTEISSKTVRVFGNQPHVGSTSKTPQKRHRLVLEAFTTQGKTQSMKKESPPRSENTFAPNATFIVSLSTEQGFGKLKNEKLMSIVA